MYSVFGAYFLDVLVSIAHSGLARRQYDATAVRACCTELSSASFTASQSPSTDKASTCFHNGNHFPLVRIVAGIDVGETRLKFIDYSLARQSLMIFYIIMRVFVYTVYA